jgi:hypothetical protein
MARGRKTGGRQRGARNRSTAEARAAASATGVLPLDYMLSVMRAPATDDKRRDAMAMAAAPYLHARLSTIDATFSPAVAEPSPEKSSIVVEFVVPSGARTREDQE